MSCYEYAVQKPHPHDGWAFIITNPETDEISITPHPHWADWHDNFADAECFTEGVDGARIVRRPVGDVEVVENNPPAPNRIHFCTEEDLFGDIEEVDE